MATENTILFRLELDDAEAEKRIAKNNARLREASEERKELNKQIKEGKISSEDYGRSLEKLTREQKDLRDENKQLNTSLQANENTLEGLRKKLSALSSQRNVTDIATKEFQDLQKEILETNNQIKGLEEAGGDFRRSVGNYQIAGQAIADQFGGIGSAITGALGPAGAILALTAGIAKLFEFTAALAKTREEVNLLTGATGPALDEITSKVQATSDAFKTDFNETLIAANSLAKGFGITTQEATDLLQKGFAAGGNATGELLATTTEYSRLLEEVGLTAEQSINIISRQVKEGIFSDKGVDSIKEAGLRLREFTPATKEAIDGIGISSSELQKGLENGTITMFEAIQKVSNRLGELPEQSNEVGTAIADIFGGAGEDAGLEYLKTLGKIEGGLDDLVDESGEVASANLRIVEANEKINLAFNQLFGGAGDGFKAIKAAALEFAANALQRIITGLEGTLNFFIELYNESLVFRSAVEGIGFVFESVFGFVQAQLDSVIDAFSGFGQLIKAVLTGDFASIEGILEDVGNNIVDNYKEFGKDVATNFIQAANDVTSEEKVKAFSFSASEEEAIVSKAGEIGQKVTEAAKQSNQQRLEDQKAFYERQILLAEENSREQLDFRIKLSQIERDIELQQQNLTSEQILLIKAQQLEEENQLIVDFSERQKEIEQQRIADQLEQIQEAGDRKTLLLQQQLLNDQIAIEEFNERIFEINEERLEKEIEQFEEGTLARLEKEVELEQLRSDRLQAVKDKEKNANKALADASIEQDKARLASAKSLASGLQDAAQENTIASKAAGVIQKTVGLGEVAINLQRQLAANSVAGAKIAAAGAPATVPAGLSYTASQNALAVISAAVQGAKIAASFDKGGIASDNMALSGGYIPMYGGMIVGASHGQGGVKFNMGNSLGEADGRKGEAYIVNTRHDPTLKAIASAINVAGGGNAFFNYGGVARFQDGGIASTLATSDIFQKNEDRNTILEVLENLPPQKVLVDDIDDGLTRKTIVENTATI